MHCTLLYRLLYRHCTGRGCLIVACNDPHSARPKCFYRPASWGTALHANPDISTPMSFPSLTLPSQAHRAACWRHLMAIARQSIYMAPHWAQLQLHDLENAGLHQDLLRACTMVTPTRSCILWAEWLGQVQLWPPRIQLPQLLHMGFSSLHVRTSWSLPQGWRKAAAGESGNMALEAPGGYSCGTPPRYGPGIVPPLNLSQ